MPSEVVLFELGPAVACGPPAVVEAIRTIGLSSIIITFAILVVFLSY